MNLEGSNNIPYIDGKFSKKPENGNKRKCKTAEKQNIHGKQAFHVRIRNPVTIQGSKKLQGYQDDCNEIVWRTGS
jgi:hypothetical protein